jgi:glycosyltransferase involved in cell wall biosynthesis
MATPAHPTVSAVIPVHDGEDFVDEAVRSVLAQTAPVIECIVVDDGSTDATAAIVQAHGERVTYVHQPQGGVSAARNHGARLARGEVVAFLDHDDVWRETKLERQLPALADPAVTLVMCALDVVDASGAVTGTKRLGSVDRLVAGMLLFDGTPTLSCSSTGVFRREPFLAMGGFDTQLSMSADWDVLLRTLLQGRVAYVDEPLTRYRVHGANMSRSVAAMERDMRHAFGKTFADPALPPDLRRRRGEAYGRLYRMLAGSYRDHGQRLRAARALGVAMAHHPALAVELASRRR